MTSLPGFAPWPAELVQRYRAAGYWTGITIGEMFDRSVRAYADRTALVASGRRWSYAEVGVLTRRLAGHLLRLGIKTYDRVILQLPNCLEFVLAYFACQKVGAIPLNCLPAYRHAEVEHFAELIEAVAYFIPREHRGFNYPKMAREIREGNPGLKHLLVAGGRGDAGTLAIDDLLETPAGEEWERALDHCRPDPLMPAVLLLSGGTTGTPKVIPRTHEDFLCLSRSSGAGTGFSGESVLLLTLPVTHILPLAAPGLQGAFMLGAKVVLAPSPDPALAFPLIEGERVTFSPLVPPVLVSWINSPKRAEHDLSSLRALPTGGMKLTAELARQAHRVFGDAVMQEYGMSEGFVTSTRPGDPLDWILETQGRPVSPGDEFRVVDEDGREVSAGEVGELVVRGPYTVRGYLRAADHNRVAFTADGFYRTGDMVRLHPSGNVVIEGRKKDMINRGGEHISAEEVESLILSHPRVLNAAVVAMPDPLLGERVCAYAILRSGESLTLEELCRFLLEEKRVAKLKLPERLEVVAEFPLTPVGKVSKPALRQAIRQRLETERTAAAERG
jgi:2,3-dihydroxybenzoate-AMP ligase